MILLQTSLRAQVQIQNGGMEQWIGFNLIRPDNWTPVEQALGMKTNEYVFREVRPENVNSGQSSIRLTTDKVAGMIAYGKAGYVAGKLATTGLPVYGRPVSLSMYVKIYHPVSDTASMRLLLTRWNPQRHQADTLAYERRYIFPDSMVMSGFALFADSIHYLMSGEADTARLIISGGRSGDDNLKGNTVWIDDLSFNYAGTQIVHGDIEDVVFLYPNPATTRVNIKADPTLFGYTIYMLDAAGMTVKQATIDDGATSIDVSDLHQGSYCYAVLDRDKKMLYEGNINILR
jgi:hypothetical protein